MSKSSRRPTRAGSPSRGAAAPGGAPPSTTRPASSGPSGTPRAGRRERVRTYDRPSFLERYRSAVIGVGVVAVIGLIGAFVFLSASAPTYACSTEWSPDPTTSPAAGSSPRLGYVQPNLGQSHDTGTLQYTLCPPASGPHYNIANLGPIRPGVYGPSDAASPGGWVHNLEHGALVVLYNPTLAPESAGDEMQAEFKDFYSTFPESPICGVPANNNFSGMVIARFDQMKWPYAALVWNRVLPLDEWDPELIRQFHQTEGERTSPELPAGCSRAPSSPSPSAPASPEGSAAPSATPAPSAS